MAPATKDERYAARSILATSETSGLKFAAVAAILWRSDDPRALNSKQAEALLHWLRLGGVLVVAGGRAVKAVWRKINPDRIRRS